MTSTLIAFAPEVILLQLPLFLDTSFAEQGIVKKEWELSEKPLKPMKKIEEENWKTNKNILAL